jgi:ribonuclease HI
MTAIRLWIETTHHAAFRYGGWAYAREVGGAVSGMAGGERNITAGRLDLAGLVAALNGLPAGAAVAVKSSSPALLAALRAISSPPAEAPTEDLDLWAQLMTAAKGRAVTLQAAPRAAQTPAAFLAAWAEVGQDKAKAAGRFSAAIPKSNLAKLALG